MVDITQNKYKKSLKLSEKLILILKTEIELIYLNFNFLTLVLFLPTYKGDLKILYVEYVDLKLKKEDN